MHRHLRCWDFTSCFKRRRTQTL